MAAAPGGRPQQRTGIRAKLQIGRAAGACWSLVEEDPPGGLRTHVRRHKLVRQGKKTCEQHHSKTATAYGKPPRPTAAPSAGLLRSQNGCSKKWNEPLAE